jgi:hypothetical protein
LSLWTGEVPALIVGEMASKDGQILPQKEAAVFKTIVVGISVADVSAASLAHPVRECVRASRASAL